MKSVVYFVPFSESGLENKLFSPFSNSKANVPPFDYLKNYLEKNNIEAKTIDYWSGLESSQKEKGDLVVVFDHPPIGIYKFLYQARDLVRGKNSFSLKNKNLLKILPRFKRKILLQWESAVNNPWVYKNISTVVAHYDEAYFIPKAKNFPHFYYPQNFSHLNEEHFNKPREKFAVMMNSFTKAKGFWKNELYSERIKALEFFGQYDEVDLYGPRWGASSSLGIKKNWHGFADDKPATMSQYTFALCFENAIWPGYVTEKIFDCLLVGTIPIYLGAPDIEDDVPVDCFIDVRKFLVKGHKSIHQINYEDLRKFLHILTPEDIKKYKEAIRVYFSSPNFKKFTPEYFGQTILKIIQGQKI